MARTSSPKPSSRWLLLTVLVVLLGASIFGAARWVRHQGIQRLHQSAEARGWKISVADPRVRLDGRIRIGELCISLLGDDHQDVCVTQLRVGVEPLSALKRALRVDDIRAEHVRIHSSLERLEQARPQAEEPRDTNANEQRGGRLPSFQHVRIDEVSIHIDLSEGGITAGLQDIALSAPGSKDALTAWTVTASGSLQRLPDVDPLIVAALQDIQGKAFELQAAWNQETRALQHASLRFTTPATAHHPSHEDVTFRWDAVEFEHPYALRIVNPTLDVPHHGLRAEAAYIEATVGQWTTHLPDLYLASLLLQTPTIQMASSRVNEGVRALRGLGIDVLEARRARLLKDEDAQGTDGLAPSNAVPTNPSTDATVDANAPSTPPSEEPSQSPPSSRVSSLPSGLAKEFARRRWWEIAPRAIQVRDGSVHLENEDATEVSVQLGDLHLDYGLRVLQRQIDVELRTTIYADDTASGQVETRLEWNYERSLARVAWEANEVELAILRRLIPSKRLAALSGQLQVQGDFRTHRDQRLTGQYASRVHHLHVEHPRLQAPLSVKDAGISGPFVVSREQGRAVLELKNQQLHLEDATAELSLNFEDFRLLQRPQTSRVHVLFEVPDQPAMQLFEAIPATIRGPVADAKMAGTWGLTLAFAVQQTDFTADGAPLWEIQAPSVYRLRDQQLSLLSLPEDVDVRRLNGPMDFVFRGPNDSMMRTMRIPASSGGETYADTATNSAGWVPLRNMSYYFVATQLYREDGSFFRNSGINWMQLRRVLSEALTTRELSRGASTITMQTVKNVFLSHERSIERKVQELFLSYWLTRSVPKARILEVYLNVIELGPDCNGADAASRFYFHTPIAELGIRESVWLSSISPNPLRIGGTQPKGRIEAGSCVRCDRLIQGLFQRQWISAQEHREGLGAIPEAQNAPDISLEDVGLFGHDTPPLFELMDSDNAPKAVDRLPLDARIQWWIQESKVPRGTRAGVR